MKAKLTRDVQASHKADDERIIVRDDGYRYWPAGSVLEGPEAWKLVGLGNALPDDDECREMIAIRGIDMSERAQAFRASRVQMVERGIHPDDYERYEAGEIVGYDEDGNDIPGPNYTDDEDDE